MPHTDFYPFYPKRLLWKGIGILGGALTVGGLFLFCWFDATPFILESKHSKKREMSQRVKSLSFSFVPKAKPIPFPFSRLESELIFSFDPPRPDGGGGRSGDILARLKQSAQSKRINLPGRLDLQFNEGKLALAESGSPFWLELKKRADEKIEAVVWVDLEEGRKIETERFIALLQNSPLQAVQELGEGSPFKMLAEARWLGRDVFNEKYGGQHQTFRLLIGGGQIVSLSEGDWLIWKDGSWGKGALSDKSLVIARIESFDSKNLILEGWDGDLHVRFSCPASLSNSFKIRGDEIFSTVRIRSEKQISCVMEKQSLILRCGDWVLKSNGRWKVLRKKEEKDSYKSGKIIGELFVFERIESKLGQKFVVGVLFNPEKSQAIPVNFAAQRHPSRKEAKEK